MNIVHMDALIIYLNWKAGVDILACVKTIHPYISSVSSALRGEGYVVVYELSPFDHQLRIHILFPFERGRHYFLADFFYLLTWDDDWVIVFLW